MLWNSYPLHTRNSVIKWLRNNTKTKTNYDKNDEKKIVWVTLPYLGHIGDKMKKRFFIKVLKFNPCIASFKTWIFYGHWI